MKSEIPEKVRNYADMAYAAAQSRIENEGEVKLADLRAKLGEKELSGSRLMGKETAQLQAERVNALVLARANALMEGYELHGRMDEQAANAILEDVSLLHKTVTKGIISGVTDRAKMEAWRTRSSGTGVAAQAQEFGREVQRLSTTVLNEVGCEIERRRVTPKLRPEGGVTPTKPAAVRPVGQYEYHPEIQRVSQRLWEEGNFRQAVLDAFIHVIHTVRDKSGLVQDGDNLMNHAFSPDNRTPPVMFNRLRTEGEKNEQRGIWYLFKGIVGLRNFKAHVVATFDDPQRAHEYLALASLLFRLLDAATIDPPAPVDPSS